MQVTSGREDCAAKKNWHNLYLEKESKEDKCSLRMSPTKCKNRLSIICSSALNQQKQPKCYVCGPP